MLEAEEGVVEGEGEDEGEISEEGEEGEEKSEVSSEEETGIWEKPPPGTVTRVIGKRKAIVTPQSNLALSENLDYSEGPTAVYDDSGNIQLFQLGTLYVCCRCGNQKYFTGDRERNRTVCEDNETYGYCEQRIGYFRNY